MDGTGAKACAVVRSKPCDLVHCGIRADSIFSFGQDWSSVPFRSGAILKLGRLWAALASSGGHDVES